jgi:AcrR family transcriptional regulator
MARLTTKPARVRVPLTRQRAFAAAVDLADQHGLGAVSMRRLAEALGVEAMSLYHHVPSKQHILDGMVEAVFAEIELPPDNLDWKPAMRLRAESVRAALTRHPWAISIMESRRSPGPATLRHHDAVIGCCRKAGFSIAMAAHAFSVLDSYIYGFVLQEVNLPFDSSDSMDEMLDEIMPDLSAEDYPHLVELTTRHILQPGYDHAEEFDHGLGLILDGLEAQVRKAGPEKATAAIAAPRPVSASARARRAGRTPRSTRPDP